MGPINWVAVGIAGIIGSMCHLLWKKRVSPATYAHDRPAILGVTMAAAAMLGHMYARLGAETLAAKPWLFWMQSGGLVLAFVGPAVWLGQVQAGKRGREAALDAGSWLLVYLAMGTVFWMMR